MRIFKSLFRPNIKRLEEKEDLAGLIKALRCKDRYVMAEAAEALGNIGDEKAVEALIGSLKDDEDRVRESAARALGNTGNRAAIEPLINLLGNESQEVRKSAEKALEDLNIPVNDESYLEICLSNLNNKNNYIRLHSIKIIEKAGWEKASDRLIEILFNKNDPLRCNAVKALGEIRNIKAVKPLLEILEENDDELRWYAAEALGKTGHPSVIEPLTGLLKDRDELVRWQAIEALGNRGYGEAAIEYLIELLKDEEDLISLWAQEALIKSGKSVLSYLINALDNEDWKTGEKIIDIIKNIEDKSTVEVLIESLNDIYEIRIKAAEALKEYVMKNTNITYSTLIGPLCDIISESGTGKDEAASVLKDILKDYRPEVARVSPLDIYSIQQGMEFLKVFSPGWKKSDEEGLLKLIEDYSGKVKDIVIFQEEPGNKAGRRDMEIIEIEG